MVQRYILFFNSKQNRIFFLKKYQKKLLEIDPGTGTYFFEDFFDAFYWAACTLTTVGYGDIYPVSDVGRLICIISSMVGIAIIALPSGIITAGYLDKLRASKEKKDTEE